MFSEGLKSVLITGAGSGIGASTAKVFSERGYFVYLLGRNAAHLESAAQNLPHKEIVICDLTDPDQVKNSVQNILKKSDLDLQVLVNNAGIFRRHSFEEGSEEVWMSQWWSNMMAPVRLTRELFPYFRQKKRGSIVNSWTSTDRRNFSLLSYKSGDDQLVSKFGFGSFTLQHSCELHLSWPC
jgi:short-subunit dehydrogenase